MAYEESTEVREQGAGFADTGPEVREADTGMEAVSGLQDMYDLLTDTMEAGISSYDPVEGSQSAVSFEDVLGMTVDQPFVDYAGDVRESADLSDLCAAVNNMGEEKGVMNMGSDAFEDALERYCQDMGEAVDKDALSALTSDMTASMLKDYSYVIRTLDRGLCVAVSMYSPNVGEAEGVIYGYTPDGDLLVADPKSLKAAGTIHITEYAMRMMGRDGQIGQHTWFEWEGLGFDSLRNGDRIVFGASSASSELTDPEAETEGGNS